MVYLYLSGGVIMSNPKREDGSPMNDGINNNTYNYRTKSKNPK